MFKKKLIRVEFYNADSGEKIGYDEQRLKKLPEDFEPETFVEIDGQRYQVVQAEPEERKAIKRGGSLIIKMVPAREEGVENKAAAFVAGEQEVEPVQRRLKTFLSASHSNIFPSFTGQRDGLRLLEMGAWEWRSAEFVHGSHALDIKTEFASIRDLKRYHARTENGREVYSRQHRRSLISQPLGAQSIALEELGRKHFPKSRPSQGITFMGSEGYADGGFSLRLENDLAVYGLAPAGEVTAIGLTGWEGNGEADLTQVQAFMEANGFVLVDWVGLEIVRGDMESLQNWLLEKAAKPKADPPKSVPESAVLLSEEEEAEVLAGLQEIGVEVDGEDLEAAVEMGAGGEATVQEEEAAPEEMDTPLVEAAELLEREEEIDAALADAVEGNVEAAGGELNDLAVEGTLEVTTFEEESVEAAAEEAVPELNVVDFEPIESKEEE